MSGQAQRMALYILIGVAFVYGCVLVGMMLGQRHLVFHPAKRNAFLNAVPPFEIVTVTTPDGLALKGFYIAPKDGKPLVIYYHGNAGDISDRLFKAEQGLAAGYGFLMTEYRAYGGNPGIPSEKGLYTDARAWIDFAKQQGFTPDRLVYYGESLGTGVAVQMASEQPPKALILEAPFTSVPDVGAFYYPFLPVHALARYHFDSLSKAHTLKMPVLIYHGKRDMTVPYRFGQTLFAAIPSERKVFETFPKAGHANLYAHGAGDAVLKFLHDDAL